MTAFLKKVISIHPCRTGGLRLLAALILCGLGSFAMAAADPDAYETEPYDDSSSATTSNYLSEGDVQYHSLHTLADEDWGIASVYTSGSAFYSLRFNGDNLYLPPGGSINVDIYDSGQDAPGVSDFLSTGTDIGFQAQSGFNYIYYRIYSDDISVDPSTSYTIELVKASGANNGIAVAVGSSRVNLTWETTGASFGSDQGFRIRRSCDGVTFSTLNATLVPIPASPGACDCEKAVGAGCASYSDTNAVKAGIHYIYNVVRVLSDNSTAEVMTKLVTTSGTDDTDGDGISDQVENNGNGGTCGTDMFTKDSDGDGFEDGVEKQYNSDRHSSGSAPPSGIPYNSTADTDGDGYKDFYEYGHGFPYDDPTSHPSLGNINGDSALNGADAIILKRVAVGTLSASSFSFNTMDVNRDGSINGADAIILQRRVVGTVLVLPTN